MSTIVKGLKLHAFIVKGEGVSSAIRIFSKIYYVYKVVKVTMNIAEYASSLQSAVRAA